MCEKNIIKNGGSTTPKTALTASTASTAYTAYTAHTMAYAYIYCYMVEVMALWAMEQKGGRTPYSFHCYVY